MSTGHLVATPITDKNGKQTTVLKKPLKSPSAVNRIPAPSMHVAAAPSPTRLIKPNPLTPQESEDWASHLNSGTTQYEQTIKRETARLEPDTQALLKAYTDAGVLLNETRNHLVGAMGIGLERRRNKALEHNLVLVAERLRSDERVPALMQLVDCHKLMVALEGVNYLKGAANREPIDKIGTAEELEKISALVHATIRWDSEDKDHLVKPFQPRDKEMVKVYTAIRNKYLSSLIIERPQDVDRIIDYLDERAVSNKSDVDEIRRYLDSPAGQSAVAEGWL
jgi:hypothetical protein